MRIEVLALTATIGLSAAGSAWAQVRPMPPRSFQALTAEVRQTDDMRGVLDLRVRWVATVRPQGGATSTFRLLDRRRESGRLRRERRPELGPDRLVIVSLDAAGRELDWRITRNPRTLRAEVPTETGELTGRVLESDAADFSIAVPDIPGIASVRVYQPRWSGSEYTLEPLGELRIEGAQ
jgi:hypothetical protein